MSNHEDHVKILDKQITELSDALAHLGKGTDLKELIRIIRFPGWTTQAELAFFSTIVESMQTQAKTLAGMSAKLLADSKLVAANR